MIQPIRAPIRRLGAATDGSSRYAMGTEIQLDGLCPEVPPGAS